MDNIAMLPPTVIDCLRGRAAKRQTLSRAGKGLRQGFNPLFSPRGLSRACWELLQVPHERSPEDPERDRATQV